MDDHDHVSSPSPSPPPIDNPSQTRSVDFSPSEIQRLQDQHTLSLYAKILGWRVRYDHFSSYIRNVFKPHGNMEVISLSNDFFLLKFSNPADYQNALQNGPWTINNNYIDLLPWIPNFKPSERSITRTKVWIRLYELPVEYYDKEALSRIAEQIAPLVKIDPVTESMSKCKFARFCVDLNLLQPLIDSVKLPNGFMQKIRYEGLRYNQCWGCRMVGHVQKYCPESTSIASQEVRLSWDFPGVLGSRTPPGDPAAGFPVVVAGSGVDDPDISRANFRGESRTRPLDAAPDSSVADAGSGFDVLDISRANSREESRIRPLDAAPDSSVPDAGSGFNDPDISRRDSPPESRIRPLDGAPDSSVAYAGSGFDVPDISRVNSSAPPLLELQIPDQEASFVNSGEPHIEDDYFPNMVFDAQPNENQEVMTPGSIMKHQAILRGVVELEVMLDPVEIQEVSNAGLPKVYEMDPKVRSFSINVMIYSSGNGNLYRNILTPVEIDHTPSAASPSPEKHFVLFFNCRGAREAPVIRALKDLVEKYGFSVVVLTETKTSGIEAGRVIEELGFSGKFIIEPVENSGGVWLLWDENRITVEVRAHDQHYFYALAQAPVIAQNLGESWLDVYGFDDV